jgi:hypothetical protein
MWFFFMYKFSEPLVMSTPQPAANKPTIEEENDSNTFSDEDCCEFEYNPETRPPETETADESEDDDDTSGRAPPRKWVNQPR